MRKLSYERWFRQHFAITRSSCSASPGWNCSRRKCSTLAWWNCWQYLTSWFVKVAGSFLVVDWEVFGWGMSSAVRFAAGCYFWSMVRNSAEMTDLVGKIIIYCWSAWKDYLQRFAIRKFLGLMWVNYCQSGGHENALVTYLNDGLFRKMLSRSSSVRLLTRCSTSASVGKQHSL